jgi:hypothetical protein
MQEPASSVQSKPASAVQSDEEGYIVDTGYSSRPDINDLEVNPSTGFSSAGVYDTGFHVMYH